MPPPPPQTPNHPEESGQPLEQRPGQKAGDFVERDLWDLDDEFGGSSEQAEADAPDSARQEPDSSAREPTDQPDDAEVTKLEKADDADGEPLAEEADEGTVAIEDEDPADTGDWDDSDAAVEATGEEAEPSPASKPAAVPAAEVADETDEPPEELELSLEPEQAKEPDATDIGKTRRRAGEGLADDADWELDSEEIEEPGASAESSGTPEPEPEPPKADPESPEPATSDSKADAPDEFLDPTPEPAGSGGKKLKPLRLSTTEWISLGLVLVFILGGLAWFMKSFFNQIPTRQSQVPEPDFPVRGELIGIESAASFWREPVRSGPNPDTARRDARLIPVIELKIKETMGEGDLRVFFRDEAGDPVGDPATRAFGNGVFTLNGADQLQLAATAGFDDEGKHAAYQTTQTDPWTVEVFEGSRDATSFKDFRLLFTMPISAERR